MFRLYSEIEFLQQIKAGYLILEHMEVWMSGLNQHTANVQGHWLRRFESVLTNFFICGGSSVDRAQLNPGCKLRSLVQAHPSAPY